MLAIIKSYQKVTTLFIRVDLHHAERSDELKVLYGIRIHTPTQLKWLPKILDYDYVIRYKKGFENWGAMRYLELLNLSFKQSHYLRRSGYLCSNKKFKKINIMIMLKVKLQNLLILINLVTIYDIENENYFDSSLDSNSFYIVKKSQLKNKRLFQISENIKAGQLIILVDINEVISLKKFGNVTFVRGVKHKPLIQRDFFSR